jgi:CelD/BcsL family acetyltransferase involved in cellulose biosynthesis
LASPRFAAFLYEVSERLFDQGLLHLYLLDLDGRPVAAEFQVCCGQGIYAYQSGIEPDALPHQPGRLITLATLQAAIADGRRTFDFLRGDEPYKAHWRARPRPADSLFLVPNSRAARLEHQLWLARDAMKHWVKRRLGATANSLDL